MTDPKIYCFIYNYIGLSVIAMRNVCIGIIYKKEKSYEGNHEDNIFRSTCLDNQTYLDLALQDVMCCSWFAL